MLEKKQVGLAVAGNANEVLIEKLDRSVDVLVIAEPHPDRDLLIDQMSQVLGFFKGLVGSFRLAGHGGIMQSRI